MANKNEPCAICEDYIKGIKCENEEQAQELFDNKEYFMNTIGSQKAEVCDNEEIEFISMLYSENDDEGEENE